MKKMDLLTVRALGLILAVFPVLSRSLDARTPHFKALVLSETGGQHGPFTDAAKKWLYRLADDGRFTVDCIENTEKISDALLDEYQVFMQLDYPPYSWNPTAAAAIEKSIREGRGMGWVGFHHAALLGEFDGFPLWTWFSEFMGGIRFDNYIAGLAGGLVRVEDRGHPAMKNVPASFFIDREEWYTWDKNPRPGVHVIATVDESTYNPPSDIRMGDHPVIWTNERFKARNIYIFMGHHPDLFKNESYVRLVRNSIFWAAGRQP